jgi:hypothetical protein
MVSTGSDSALTLSISPLFSHKGSRDGVRYFLNSLDPKTTIWTAKTDQLLNE